MTEQRNDNDVREILRLIAVIRNKEYQRGWRDAVSAMKTAVENIQHTGPVAEVVTPEGEGRVRYMEGAPSAETADAEKQEGPTIHGVGQR
jgi:hypothetical protein